MLKKILDLVFCENGQASCSRLIAVLLTLTFLIDIFHSIITKHMLEVNMSAIIVVTSAWGLNLIQSVGIKNVKDNVDNTLKQSKMDKYIKINYNK